MPQISMLSFFFSNRTSSAVLDVKCILVFVASLAAMYDYVLANKIKKGSCVELLGRLLKRTGSLGGIPFWSFCHFFFLLPGADGMMGVLAAVLFHEVTLWMKASIN